MRGGITLVPPPAGIRRMTPRSDPPPGPVADRKRFVPPGIVDIRPESGASLNELRVGPAAGRDRNESVEPPPSRPGMNPSNDPP